MDSTLIGEQIAKFRKAAGLTQEELGRSVGVSTQAVSRWECGGTPDVSLLPAIADRLGVTIDALFGREGGAAEDIHAALDRWLLSLPEEKRLEQLCRLLWRTSAIMAVQKLGDVSMLNLGYLDSCLAYAGSSQYFIRTAVDTDSGLIFGVGAEDLSFMSIWPRPAAGYAAWFAPRDRCREFFALLARPGCLELLERLHDDCETRYYAPEALARQLGLPVPEVAELLSDMEKLGLVKKLDLELESGPINAYLVHENWAFMPLMLFVRCFLEKNNAFYVCWDDHQFPADTPDALRGRLTAKNLAAAPPASTDSSGKGERK